MKHIARIGRLQSHAPCPDWTREIAARVGVQVDSADDQPLIQELADHLQDRYEGMKRNGATEEEAVAAALAELESVELPGRAPQPGARCEVAMRARSGRGATRADRAARADSGGRPLVRQPPRGPLARPPLRRPHAAPHARLHVGRHFHTRPRYRCEHDGHSR